MAADPYAVRAVHVLNYADFAAPLTFDRIKLDIDLIRLGGRAPDRIELWRHQLNWLKQQIPRKPRSHEIWYGLDKEFLATKTTIWGIEVEVLNP